MAERTETDERAWAKPLRSYRLRGRPLTASLQAAYETLPQWAFPVHPAAVPVAAISSYDDGEIIELAPAAESEIVDLAELFGNDQPVVMEIGFGMGETTLVMAAAQPERNLVAVDVHRNGVAALLRGIGHDGVTNIRIARGDATEILSRQIAEGALDEVRVFFPDPWPKAGHHRRRLVNGAFAALVASRLRPGGRLHLATDWEHYAEQMRDVIASEPLLCNLSERPDGFVERPAHRPVTRFEQIGLDKGHRSFDLIAERC